MSKASTDAAKLTEYLEMKLLNGDYRPSFPLPSVRRLATKFNMSYSTAYRTLCHLATTGLVIQDESGAFLAGSLPPAAGNPSHRIAALLEGIPEDGGLIDTLLLGVRDQLLPAGYELMPQHLHPTCISSALLIELGRQYDGLMLLNSYDWMLSDFPCVCPAVGVLMQNSYNGRLGLINLDPVDAARQAVRYFLDKACHHVVIITSPAPAYRLRGQLFRLFWEEIGGSCALLDGWRVEHALYQQEYGYFFTSDTILHLASVQHQRQYGVPLSSAFTVLGVDGKRRSNPDYHEFPSIGVDWRILGRLAAEELLRQMASPLSERRSLLLAGTLLSRGH